MVQAIGVHVLFGLILFYGLATTSLRVEPQIPLTIQATVVSRERLVEARQEREAQALEARRQEAAERRAAERRAEERRQAEAERQAAARAERERRAEAEAEAQRLRREQREQEQALAAERQRQLEDLRRQQAEAQAEREAREAELERLAGERRRQEEQRQQDLEAQRRQQLLELEGRQLAEARQATLEQQWVAAIQALVTQNWRRPPSAPSGTVCLVRVDQLPGGDVISATVQPGCRADEITRRSIIDAVMRSEPLPYRGFEEVFRRSLVFEFVVSE